MCYRGQNYTMKDSVLEKNDPKMGVEVRTDK